MTVRVTLISQGGEQEEIKATWANNPDTGYTGKVRIQPNDAPNWEHKYMDCVVDRNGSVVLAGKVVGIDSVMQGMGKKMKEYVVDETL